MSKSKIKIMKKKKLDLSWCIFCISYNFWSPVSLKSKYLINPSTKNMNNMNNNEILWFEYLGIFYYIELSLFRSTTLLVLLLWSTRTTIIRFLFLFFGFIFIGGRGTIVIFDNDGTIIETIPEADEDSSGDESGWWYSSMIK